MAKKQPVEVVPEFHKKAMKVAREIMKHIKDLKEIRMSAPRAGVKPTKVIKDKTKYSRKRKHKKS